LRLRLLLLGNFGPLGLTHSANLVPRASCRIKNIKNRKKAKRQKTVGTRLIFNFSSEIGTLLFGLGVNRESLHFQIKRKLSILKVNITWRRLMERSGGFIETRKVKQFSLLKLTVMSLNRRSGMKLPQLTVQKESVESSAMVFL